jgi:hypothetical protein
MVLDKYNDVDEARPILVEVESSPGLIVVVDLVALLETN